MPSRKVLVTVASASFKTSLLRLVILLKGSFLSARKLGLCKRKSRIFNAAVTSAKRIQCIMKVTFKLEFMKVARPSRNLVKYLINFRLWQLKKLFAVGLLRYYFSKY